jgi:transposase
MYKQMPIHVSIHLRYLHQDLGVKGNELLKRYKDYSRASIFRHAKKKITDITVDKRKFNQGRPKKLSVRDERNILRQIPKLRRSKGKSYSIKDVRKESDVPANVSDRTVSRVLYKVGYGYRKALRKGILTEKDAKLRLKFARDAQKMLSAVTWSNDICFYLDGVGFAYRSNPCESANRRISMCWRKNNEGRDLYCTSAGNKEGSGGKVGKFMVTIAHSKGITLCEEYKTKLNGESFASFIRTHFPSCFENSVNPTNKLFLQDGDPSQNSRLAMGALGEIGGRKFAIPPRSPDLNPIENVFNIAKANFRRDSIEQKITQETYSEFVKRVKETLHRIPVTVIDKVIDTMEKRIKEIIKRKGQRIKY